MSASYIIQSKQMCRTISILYYVLSMLLFWYLSTGEFNDKLQARYHCDSCVPLFCSCSYVYVQSVPKWCNLRSIGQPAMYLSTRFHWNIL